MASIWISMDFADPPVIINYGPLSFRLEKCLNRNLQSSKAVV